MKHIKRILLFFIISQTLVAQKINQKSHEAYPKSFVNYETFKSLVNKVESHRAERMVSFNNFLKLSKEENTIILDTRSAYFYKKRHIKGAINLPFTEFTQKSLRELIPDTSTKILIYCNNNFKDDKINFASKMAKPSILKDTSKTKQLIPDNKDKTKYLTLALNIPTYINLYGYGYKSVFELEELLSIFDTRVAFEGSDVLKEY